MTSTVGPAVMILVGGSALFATVNGTYTNYVKAGLRWPLFVASLVLIALGIAGLVYRARARQAGESHVEIVGLLLLVFVMVLAMAPAPLGADALSDRAPNRIAVPDSLPPIASEPAQAASPADESSSAETNTADTTTTTTTEAAITSTTTVPVADPAPVAEDSIADSGEVMTQWSDSADDLSTDGTEHGEALVMGLYDVISYTYFAPDEIIDVPVEVVGFVAPEPDRPGGFRLTRFLMSCCAVDAFPMQISVADPPYIPADDEWVRAIAVWRGAYVNSDASGDSVPLFEVISLEIVDAPEVQYEY